MHTKWIVGDLNMEVIRPLERTLYVLTASVLACSSAQGTEVVPRQLYEITTETSMPHLEENLRYATTRVRHCLEENELWSAFPILHHDALKDCRLVEESRHQRAVSYALICKSRTTGRATWQLGRDRNTGTLDVKLGGKNMTFYQRITARSLGDCSSPARK
jgi:hypothetical protein